MSLRDGVSEAAGFFQGFWEYLGKHFEKNGESGKDAVDRLLFNYDLQRSLRSARISIPVDKYMMMAVLLPLVCAVCIAYIGVYLQMSEIDVNPLPFLPQIGTILLAAVLIPAGIFACIYYYPLLESSGRKSKIDLDLPYAITYMQALSNTLPLYAIIRSVYEASDLYGEVSKECGVIVRDVELFGMDLYSAFDDIKRTTPSPNFAELMNDLMLVYKAGGALSNFFAAKSASYREIARQEMETMLQFLEMMAEIYVTAFVAGPIAVCIMIVAQNLSGQSSLAGLMPLMMIGLPLGATAIIFVLYILLPREALGITRRVVEQNEFGRYPLGGDQMQLDEAFLKQIKRRKELLRILFLLRHPLKSYISDYRIAGVFCGIAVLLVYFAYTLDYFSDLPIDNTFEVFVSVLVIAGCIPLMVAYEGRSRYVKSVEKQLPEFLREISDMRDVGMTLQSAFTMISSNKSGILSQEIQVVSHEVKYGSTLSTAMVRMEERVGLISVKRAMSLLVRASEVTDYIREILTIAISDLEHYVKMKNKRLSVSFVYIAVIYLSFGIYLYSAYQMNVAFISSFSGYDLSFDLSGTKTDMFHIGILLAFFSGIMAGQLSTNNVLAGMKHSIILISATLLIFIYYI